MLKTSQLEIFEAVVECGSVSRAAERLYTSQPYISRVLKGIEDEIGKPLFERTSQGVIPTRDGKFLYSYAKSILSDLKKIDEMKHLGIERLDTRLQVSVYSLFIQDKLFVEFAKNRLSNNITLSVREGTLEQLIGNLISGDSEIGIAVINDIELPALQRAAAAKNIFIDIWDEGPLYVHLGSLHPAYHHETVFMKDLLYSTYVHIPFDQYSGMRMEIEIDGHRMKEFKQTLAVDNYHIMPFMVKETDSFMFGNKWQMPEMSRYGLRSRRIANTEIRMYFLILSKVKKFSAEGETLLKLMRETYDISEDI